LNKYFLSKQQRSAGVPDEELINIAIRSMGLSDIHPFKPEEKVIEFVMEKNGKAEKKLRDLSLYGFMNSMASEAPAPGGGSASAYMGALGVALGTMVANLSAHKKGWDDRWEEFSIWAEKGKALQNELLLLVDEDTNAYKGIMDAFSLPKTSDEEKIVRKKAIMEATRRATLVPFRVMETAFSAFSIIEQMIRSGNPNSISDAGVGALALRACIQGAYLNVKINVSGISDQKFVDEILSRSGQLASQTDIIEREMINEINKILERR
jgi:glutamate formiminotransferase/formiminotetrahydrofolate cyclodeaminase